MRNTTIHERAQQEGTRDRSLTTLPALLARQAGVTPTAPALVTTRRQWTYQDLLAQINRLAHILHAHSIERGGRVGLIVQREDENETVELIMVLLAIMQAGATYVPLHAALPADRFTQIVQDADITTILAFRQHAGRFANVPIWRYVRLLSLEDLADELPRASSDAPDRAVRPRGEDLAYILYTTGTSSGKPKGVLVEHASLAHYARVQNEMLAIRPGDRATQSFALSFDASISDLTMLAAGASLYPLPPNASLGGQDLFDFLDRSGITVATFVPSLMLTLPDRALPLALRLLIVGGEVCSPALVERFWRPGLRILNAYGLTETTVCCSVGECAPDRPVTIGQPFPGMTLSIRDAHLVPVPDGVRGQICVGGACLARGYTDPLLTDRRFQTDPCGQMRIFLTQDEGICSPTGDLIFLGRLDASRRLKIRGQLVDLDEIEAALHLYPGMREAAVSHHQGRIVAYIVLSAAPQQGGEESSGREAETTQQLSDYLQQKLFPYMLPKAYVVLPTLPRNASGKIDYHALRAIPVRWPIPGAGAAGVQAQGPVEQGLAEMVALMLTRQAQHLASLQQLLAPPGHEEEEVDQSPIPALSWQQVNMACSAADQGLESLDAPDLAQRVFERFGVDLDNQELYVPLSLVANAIEYALTKDASQQEQDAERRNP